MLWVSARRQATFFSLGYLCRSILSWLMREKSEPTVSRGESGRYLSRPPDTRHCASKHCNPPSSLVHRPQNLPQQLSSIGHRIYRNSFPKKCFKRFVVYEPSTNIHRRHLGWRLGARGYEPSTKYMFEISVRGSMSSHSFRPCRQVTHSQLAHSELEESWNRAWAKRSE